jgi:hypothetical protein
LLSLDSLDTDTFVVRIQHLYQNNEMNSSSFFRFDKLFKNLKIYPKNETSLSLMHLIQNVNLDEIKLDPMDIRTFIISKKNISSVPMPIPTPKPSPIPSPKPSPSDPFPPQRNQTVATIHPTMSPQIILSFVILFLVISMIVLLLILLIISMSKKTFSQTSSE